MNFLIVMSMTNSYYFFFSDQQAETKYSIEPLWWLLIIVAAIILVGGLYCFFSRKKYRIVNMGFEVSGSPKFTFNVERNTQNLYIANRIYMELITRKAALEFEEDKDVIIEVYNSWYKLFNIIREEIKNVPGDYLINHDSSKALIGLTEKILNLGLRPHLTAYQVKFRKWYTSETKKLTNMNLTPQEIQKTYPYYADLVVDLKKVNKVLIDYSKDLLTLIQKN